MNWKPRPLTLEGSIAVIVVSGALVVMPALLYGYGLHVRDWKQCLDSAFWVGAFLYGIWSAIVVTKRNSQEQVRREEDAGFGKSR